MGSDDRELVEWAARRLAEILSMQEREKKLEDSPPEELKEIYHILEHEVEPILDASGVPITRDELLKMFTEWFLRKQDEAMAAQRVSSQLPEPGEAAAPAAPPNPTPLVSGTSPRGSARSLRRAMRLIGVLIMLVPLILLPAYFFVETQIPPPVATGVLTLAPATPLVGPGQTQNYSSLTLHLPSPQKANTTLTAFSVPGLSFEMSPTNLPPQATSTVAVSIHTSASLAPGTYHVIVEEREGPAVKNQTFTVDVVPALVVMKDVTFVPERLNVTRGTTVYWMNLDSQIGCCDPGYHDVSLHGAGMNVTSPILERLNVWSYTFQTPGVFYYYCTIHPWMVGVVTVGATAVTTSSTTTQTAAPSSVHVSIPAGSATNTSSPGYAPATITVVIGVNNTVIWTNNDTAPHTVTALNGSFDSGIINPGGSFTYTFATPGTYEYGCGFHPWMKGTVVVKASSSS